MARHYKNSATPLRISQRVRDWISLRGSRSARPLPRSGRGEFTRMMAGLKKGKASGVIFHKIDRSARNLKDWSAVQDLADVGIDVRFTQESINLGSNEGRLTGDFLAVIPRTTSGTCERKYAKASGAGLSKVCIRSRHIGYLNQGGGKPKIPDPTRAPHIRKAFELYACGQFSLRALSDELYRRGPSHEERPKVGRQSNRKNVS